MIYTRRPIPNDYGSMVNRIVDQDQEIQKLNEKVSQLEYRLFHSIPLDDVPSILQRAKYLHESLAQFPKDDKKSKSWNDLHDFYNLQLLELEASLAAVQI
jgi:hypothetical protein